MSEQQQHQPPLLSPRPRRAFDLPPPSAEPSEPSTPAEPVHSDNNMLNPKDLLSVKNAFAESVSRTGSIMNLTSPTLFSIFSPTAFEGSRDESSPWNTEVHTPKSDSSPRLRSFGTTAGGGAGRGGPDSSTTTTSAARPSIHRRSTSRFGHGLVRSVILPRALRSALLFAFGVIYGLVTMHVHENQWITPVKLEYTDDYHHWQYLAFWGLAGVAFGNILPWLDDFYNVALAGKLGVSPSASAKVAQASSDERTLSWNAAVRSVGAFVGIVFAMRRTPWESTTQASLTLALANPVLWYLLDRTRTGFLLSSLVGLTGMSVFLGLNPEMVPSSTEAPPTLTIFNNTGKEYTLVTGLTQESIAVRTWVASILFCACVCFGNIGRQLAIGQFRQ